MYRPRRLHGQSSIMALIVPTAAADMAPAAQTVACAMTIGATAMKRAVHVMSVSAHTRSRGLMCRRPKTKLTLFVSARDEVYVIAGRVIVRVFQDMKGKGASAAHAPTAAVGMAHVNTSPSYATTWAMTLSGEWISNEMASALGFSFLHVM